MKQKTLHKTRTFNDFPVFQELIRFHFEQICSIYIGMKMIIHIPSKNNLILNLASLSIENKTVYSPWANLMHTFRL